MSETTSTKPESTEAQADGDQTVKRGRPGRRTAQSKADAVLRLLAGKTSLDPVDELPPAIREIVDANPACGVRKVWAVLRWSPYALKVSQRRVWALMSAHNLTLVPNSPRNDLPPRGHVVTSEPNRRWATDLTTVHTKEDGVVAVMPVVEPGVYLLMALPQYLGQMQGAWSLFDRWNGPAQQQRYLSSLISDADRSAIDDGEARDLCID